ncbi:hypothetical protein DTO166G4_5385 [Paecilomyces variotii]|nr:hypothetical protein DTO032I3_7842 [Paecilomyces variotii]KAJ9204201.1 hypothetical protein DTO164E3_1963 [Paecilomyces variotii]KAJ9213055.1 hypothetical protein DTO166G4_5385 [Paecilomyces variotii]KAJ9221773.1 hypothetical protein DTO169C6_5919 [Paecilomyces variotii]KAJ9230335.1 hypothetical protein DTO169E5_8452 [Paecilomyces variotii]
MKAILQRVTSASVTVDKQLISSIGRGILVFAAIGKDDTEKDAESLAAKVLKAKLWPDDSGSTWKKSVQDVQGEVLCVSQFTLMATMKKGNKPDFHSAADPESARKLYDHFYNKVRDLYQADRVKNGVFQAMMEVELKNDGPVTIEINTNLPKPEKKETPSAQGSEGKGKEKSTESKEGESKGSQYFEFKLPASLLE